MTKNNSTNNKPINEHTLETYRSEKDKKNELEAWDKEQQNKKIITSYYAETYKDIEIAPYYDGILIDGKK